MAAASVLLVSLVMCLCFGVVVAAIGGGIYFFVRRSADSVNRTWGDLGMATGLTLKPGGVFSQPELNGEYRQRPTRLYTYNAGSQGNRTTYTAISVAVRNVASSELEITPSDSVGNFFGKMVKAQDMQIGDAEFDTRFVVKSSPPDLAAQVLSEPRLRSGIMQVPVPFRIELRGPSLQYAKRGLEEDPQLVTRLFNLLSDLADRLEAT